jgi:hypothetical protein
LPAELGERLVTGTRQGGAGRAEAAAGPPCAVPESRMLP